MNKRRSRMHRLSIAKRVALTDRDMAIFRALSKYRYLRSSYLHAFAGGASETRFKERLGDLFHEGFLDRPEAQWQFANARYQPAMYELGAGARRQLVEGSGEIPSPVTFLSERTSRQFQHAALICAFLASAELTARTVAGLRFIGWPEILERAPAATRAKALPFRLDFGGVGLVPDAVFGLEYSTDGRKSYRFFALEIDRGTMPVSRSSNDQTSYAAKLAAYHQIITRSLYRAQWGTSTLLILTATTTGARLASMLPHVPRGIEGSSFLFRAMTDFTASNGLMWPDPSVLGAPWLRAGQSQLSLARP